MRQPDKAVRIWIDTICINQADNTDKSVQVQIMGEIYSRADMTIVYLGEETHDSNLAFDFLGVLQEFFNKMGDVQITDDVVLLSTNTSPMSAEWEAVYELFARPWVWRVWVVQEVVLSRAANFLCGERMVTWEAVCQPMELLRRSGLAHLAQLPAATEAHLASGTSQLGAMHDVKFNNGLGTTHPLRRLSFVFYETMGFLASNPRGKVYGILGLSPTRLEGSIDVDYSKLVQQVYLEATAGCLAVDHVPDVLYLAGLNGKDRLLGLPSWVPDFSHDIDFNPYGFSNGDPGYCAGIVDNTRMNACVQNEKLIINRRVFDRISCLGSVRVGTFQGHDEKSTTRWYDWMAEALTIAKSSNSIGDFSQNKERLWRTLIANKMYRTSNCAPPKYESYFEQFKSSYMTNAKNRVLPWQYATLDDNQDPTFTEEQKRQAHDYLMAYIDASIGRRFAFTDAGDMGLLPANTELGDQICVVAQSRVPFVIRALGGSEEVRHPEAGDIVVPGFQLVGDCYVHSLMDGKKFAEHSPHEFILLR